MEIQKIDSSALMQHEQTDAVTLVQSEMTDAGKVELEHGGGSADTGEERADGRGKWMLKLVEGSSKIGGQRAGGRIGIDAGRIKKN